MSILARSSRTGACHTARSDVCFPLAVPLTLSLALLCVLVSAPVAWAHAQLLGSSPAAGATASTQPTEVIFEFDQDVGGTFGAVRVYDAQGDEVDDLDVSHPEGEEHWLGVGLKPHLPDGTYTATYRVISADTHIVYGGLIFSIGHPGAAPKFTVAGLIERDRSGEATAIAFGAVRGLDYFTLASMIGGLGFLIFVWRPALAAVAGAEERWARAAAAFASRLWGLLVLASALGLLVSVLGVLLQGASAAGVSLWSSLKGSVLETTLTSRFGVVWGLRAVDWAVLGALLLAMRSRGLRAAAPVASGGSDPVLIALALGSVYLALTPALAGHASVESPVGVFLPSDAIHVLAASMWVGGLACLLVALPGAARQLQGAERSRLLLAALGRFSPIALGAVVAIAATGAIQAYIDVRSLHGLLHTIYGALVIAKILLLVALVGLGWRNRERAIPALRRIVGDAGTPGRAGIMARRTMRGELALMLAVLGVTAALISYAPPIDAAAGPFATNTTIGAAELELTVEPARVGPNTIHLYLIDARTGTQFTATKELTVTARLPAKGIGPLRLRATPAGPGHYVIGSAVLSPGGTWSIEVTDRVSEFEEHSRVVKVPIR